MTQHTPEKNASESHLIRVEGLGHAYGERQIFQDLNFTVDKGEFMCIVGPSGVGKTTLLGCLSGLQQSTEGSVYFDGEKVNGSPEGLAIVFQDYSRSLMPWLSVIDNVALPLRSAGVDKKQRIKQASIALEEVGLQDFHDSYPWQLSGGMQQRVAIARALAFNPKAVIMDEPFASVDAQTRADLEDLVLKVRDELGISVLLVTHDIDEAVYLSDTVLVLAGKPAGVEALIDIDLPTPRDQLSTRSEPHFAEYRGDIYRMIKQSRKATSTSSTTSEETAGKA